jgi:phage regulator Rha-like protein
MTKPLAKTALTDKIYTIRGYQVMLDRDLAALYGVETKVLNQAVKRNPERFPSGFMFQLTKGEAELSRSQFVTLNGDTGGKNRGQNIKYLPFAFTEQGVAMLSSVLKSKRAIAINIEIMNTFVAMRRFALQANAEDRITTRLGVLEKALLQYMEKNDKRVDEIIRALNAMFKAEEKEVKKIGFKPD